MEWRRHKTVIKEIGSGLWRRYSVSDHGGTFEHRQIHHVTLIDEDEIKLTVFVAVTVQHHDHHLTGSNTLMNFDFYITVSA